MNKLITLLFVLLVFANVNAKTIYVVGEGHFFAQEDDNLSFIKEQLIYNAFRDIITKELSGLGLDPEIFWHSYDLKFEDYLLPLREKLEEKYLKAPADGEEDEKIAQEKKDAYFKTLRKVRLNRKRKFMNLSKIMRKWFVTKKISRSSQNPKYRSISIKASIDRKYLRRLYNSLLGSSDKAKFKTLYVSANYNLIDLDWNTIGANNYKDFSTTVNENWVRWFFNNKVSNVQNIEFASLDLLSQLKKHMTLPEELIINSGDSKLKNSLWLRIDLQLKNVHENKALKELKLVYMGGIVLFDLRNNKAIMNYTIEPITETYRMMEASTLKYSVVNYVYRLPIEQFKKISKTVSETSLVMNTHIIQLVSPINILDVFYLMDLMDNRGISLSVSSSIKLYQVDRAILRLGYSGTDDDLKKFLLSLKNIKLPNGNMVKLNDENKPFILAIEKGVIGEQTKGM